MLLLLIRLALLGAVVGENSAPITAPEQSKIYDDSAMIQSRIGDGSVVIPFRIDADSTVTATEDFDADSGQIKDGRIERSSDLQEEKFDKVETSLVGYQNLLVDDQNQSGGENGHEIQDVENSSAGDPNALGVVKNALSLSTSAVISQDCLDEKKSSSAVVVLESTLGSIELEERHAWVGQLCSSDGACGSDLLYCSAEGVCLCDQSKANFLYEYRHHFQVRFSLHLGNLFLKSFLKNGSVIERVP